MVVVDVLHSSCFLSVVALVVPVVPGAAPVWFAGAVVHPAVQFLAAVFVLPVLIAATTASAVYIVHLFVD